MLQQVIFSLIVPFVIILGLWILIMRQIQSGGNKAMSFGKSRAKLVSEGQTKITFKDVAGVDEAKEELREVVEFLRDPAEVLAPGRQDPQGRAAGRPSRHGQDACWPRPLPARRTSRSSRSPARTSWKCSSASAPAACATCSSRPRKHKPCLIFIDEIDAVGRHRFAGIGGGHDEREQTLNQLLVEMDGFNSNEGVILIAATNRPDVLDPALLRPGRFDRQVTVDFPDVTRTREDPPGARPQGEIGQEVDLPKIAKGTPGLLGRRPGQPDQRGGAAGGPPQQGRDRDDRSSRKPRTA